MRKEKVRIRCGRGLWRGTALGLLLSAAVFCGGCGSDEKFSVSMSTSDYQTEKSYESSGGYGSDSFGAQNAPAAEITDSGFTESDRTGASGQSAVRYPGQKLIRKVSLSVETRDFDTLMPSLETQVALLGGYIENMETYNGGRSSGSGGRYARMILRIPAEQINGFLETVSGICNIVRRSESAEDVTLTYVDMESRRNTLRTEQERLLAFLEQAKSIEEIITIEDRLSNVRYELESMEARLRTVDNQVSYSTVSLDISEVKELTPPAELTPWETASSGFLQSLWEIGDGAVDFGVWFVTAFPYLVIWAAVIAAAVFMFKRLRRNRKKKEPRWESAGETERQDK